jgi:methylisocitrate lyase
MSAAALKVYEAIHRDGGAKNVIDIMQPRTQLYDFLNYSAYEEKLDQLFARQRDAET